jgi:predicted transcriptional regulator
MPKAYPAELRAKAAAMHAQGVRPILISQELGLSQAIVLKWITRYGWTRARDSALTILKNENQKSITHKLAEVQIKEALSDQLVTDAVAAKEIKRRNGKHALQIQADLEPLVRNAARVFGWGQETGQRQLVNIQLLAPGAMTIASANDRQAPVDIESKHPLLDVEATTTETETPFDRPDGV